MLSIPDEPIDESPSRSVTKWWQPLLGVAFIALIALLSFNPWFFLPQLVRGHSVMQVESVIGSQVQYDPRIEAHPVNLRYYYICKKAFTKRRYLVVKLDTNNVVSKAWFEDYESFPFTPK